MTWFKVDDGFSDHPKVRRIPRSRRASAVGLWTLAGSWSSRHLTEGVIPGFMVEDLGCTKVQADALVDVGLWHRANHACHECPQPDAGAYVFHAWCERNPSRAQVERERQASADRQRKARERRRQPIPEQGGPSGDDLQESVDVTDMSHRDTSDVTPRHERESRSRHAVPTRPDPTRPNNQTTTSSGGRAPRSTATRIPDDFTLTDEMRDWARTNAPNATPRDHEQFLDYWRGAGGQKARKVDWQATWRNWMRKESDGRRQSTRPTNPNSAENRMQKAREIAARLAAEESRPREIEPGIGELLVFPSVGEL